MTEEKLRAEADKLGFSLVKKPNYQCSCCVPYPNKGYKHKNGKWKCVDNFRPIEFERRTHCKTTRCVRITERDGAGV